MKNFDYKQDTLVSMYAHVCKQYADRPAFTCQEDTLTYSQLWENSTPLAAYFQQVAHLKKGDRVAIMLPNILQYPVTLFAILQAGLVVVNLNPQDKAASLAYVLKHSGAKAVVVAENFVSELKRVVKKTHIEHIVITSIGSLYSPLKRIMINTVVRHIKKMVSPWHPKNGIRFRHACRLGAQHKAHFTPVKITSTDVALLQFTSGTTGHPKGVMLTHRNILANMMQCHEWVKPLVKDNHNVMVTPLPLYHIFSLTVNCFTFVSIGGENILIPNPRDISGFIKTLRKHRFTAITAVNALFHALLDHPSFKHVDCSHLSLAVGGGTAVEADVAAAWEAQTGNRLCQGYGLSEASPVVTVSPLNHPFNGSIGLAVPLTTLSIRDAKGKALPVNMPGELWVKGPQVMQGYWHNPAETTRALTEDGWLKTGDVATIDKDGFVFIVDRLKDMINVSGFNVSSTEIELCIQALPHISEVAVISIPDAAHGELPKAFVVLKDDARINATTIIRYCHKNLAAYKVPHLVEFISELPKNNLGKVLKKELR
jgi:long-chain acyl-CoA synthetase